MAEQTKSQEKGFSVALGLVDFINPLTYSINTILIAKGLKAAMNSGQWTAFLCSICLSLFIGLVIPACKLLVGLGKIEFQLPYGLFFACNLGIFVTGVTLLSLVAKKGIFIAVTAVLALLITAAGVASKKFNTSVMLLGLFGYTMIYVCMAIYAVSAGKWFSFAAFVLACAIMYGIIGFSMKADLTKPKNHWWIEGLNISCQIIFALGLLVLVR